MKRVLIIDDDHSVVRSMSECLFNQGYQVLVLCPNVGIDGPTVVEGVTLEILNLCDGEGGFEQKIKACIEEFKPEIILLDHNLRCTKIDGCSIVNKLLLDFSKDKIIGISTQRQNYVSRRFSSKDGLDDRDPEIRQSCAEELLNVLRKE